MQLKYANNHSWDFGARHRYFLVEPSDSSVKTASEALEYASKRVKPSKDRTHIIVIAMGASDSYGPNRNADGFTRKMLLNHHPTFVSHGHVFVNHKNKDPKKSVGSIEQSFYNSDMDRVELLLSLCNDRAAKFVQRIRKKLALPVSMGLHIPGDICSICGHFAPVIKKHCKHMKRGGAFGPNTVYYVHDDKLREYPDKNGKLIFVDNPAGRFFDISIVTRPADMTAYTIGFPDAIYKGSKVANYDPTDMLPYSDEELREMKEAGLSVEEVMERVRNGDPSKIADMIKKVDGIAVNPEIFKDDPIFISDKKAEVLVRGGISSLSDTLKRSCDLITFPEVFKLAHMSLYGESPSTACIQKVAEHQGSLLSTVESSPAIKAYLNTTLSLDSEGDTRHIKYARDMGRIGHTDTLSGTRHSSTSDTQKAAASIVAAAIYLEQKVSYESLCRGKAVSPVCAPPRNADGTTVSIEIHEKPSAVFSNLTKDFGRIIFG